MRGLAGAAIVATAMAQAGLIGLFGILALSGDGLGIARGMAVLLGIPFVLATLPALLLLKMGRVGPAFGLASASLPATWLIWRFA